MFLSLRTSLLYHTVWLLSSLFEKFFKFFYQPLFFILYINYNIQFLICQ
nr:MAG TPA: hypothetical protein [Caudoviricetes sp.]